MQVGLKYGSVLLVAHPGIMEGKLEGTKVYRNPCVMVSMRGFMKIRLLVKKLLDGKFIQA